MVRSGEKLQPSTHPKCSRSVCRRVNICRIGLDSTLMRVLDATSHRHVTLSAPPVAMRPPLGCQAMLVMGAWCTLRSNTASSLYVVASHIRTCNCSSECCWLPFDAAANRAVPRRAGEHRRRGVERQRRDLPRVPLELLFQLHRHAAPARRCYFCSIRLRQLARCSALHRRPDWYRCIYYKAMYVTQHGPFGPPGCAARGGSNGWKNSRRRTKHFARWRPRGSVPCGMGLVPARPCFY